MNPATAPAAAQPFTAPLAWQRLQPQQWPLPPEAFPAGCALVGGAVRDALLDRLGPEPDLDLVVEGDAVALCRQLSRRHGGSAVVLDAERSIARLVIHGWSIDLARQEGGSLEADLHRRDYTINAMALPLTDRSQLVDPLGGGPDLARGQLVAVAEANLIDDPLRLLRGLRLACELAFQLEEQTSAWIRQHHASLQAVAGERVLAELEKMAAAAAGARGLHDALHWGLLTPWQSKPCHNGALLQLLSLTPQRCATLGLMPAEQQQALPLARLAAGLSAANLKGLRSSRKLQQRVERLNRWRQQLGDRDPAQQAEALSEPMRLQLQQELEDDLPALLLSWDPERGQSWLQRWRDPGDPLFHPRAAIDGTSLQQQLGLKASPQLGALLQHLMQERAFRRIDSESEALAAAQHWLRSAQSGSEKGPRRD